MLSNVKNTLNSKPQLSKDRKINGKLWGFKNLGEKQKNRIAMGP